MSDIGADLYGQAATSSSYKDGITAEAAKGKTVIGYVRPLMDPRLVRHDRAVARSRPRLPWEVTVDSQMPAVEAGDTLAKIHVIFHLQAASPEVLESFLEALLFAHTLNSGSTLQPGRAKFSIGENTHYLDYSRIVDYLGNDLRRFFRAYANETREVNARVLEAANDPDDVVAQEHAAWLRQVAYQRGMSRHPDLAHDTADACWNLTDGERAALAASKTMVFGTTVNMADRVRIRPGQSLDPAVGNMYENPTARVHALAAQG